MNEALNMHKQLKGKIEIRAKVKVSKKNLKLIYTPGVTEATKKIAQNPKSSYEYTGRANNVAIITDGSRTLGVGDAVPEASLPVMEGKAMFLKLLAKVDGYPLCLDSKSKEEILKTIEIISPNFAAFNLEDIKSPKSLEIREELEKKNFLVFHDDEQGVAIIVLAALLNALKIVGKKLEKASVCIAGAGAAGYGIFKILNYAGAKNMIVFDSKGIIFKGRKGNNKYQQEIAVSTNNENLKGGKIEAISNCDVFIGVSGVGGLLNGSDIKIMAEKPIIFAISNPNPEIIPLEINKAVKDYIFASGRSDFRNQINNIIVFPGVFRGILDYRKKMSLGLELKIAKTIAGLVKNPSKKNIVPGPFDKRLIKTISDCIKKFKRYDS
ncbi:MAG: NADP-dependent malic enzyme [Candidatus Staskawiczbacteria bacterium]|nr:NADP-dependent malic enzyme [Candidatus Staskawiczbacteria bacterium]